MQTLKNNIVGWIVGLMALVFLVVPMAHAYPVDSMRVDEVTFGGSNHVVVPDAGGAYPATQWKRGRTDTAGNPLQSPVCYTSNKIVQVSAEFNVAPFSATEAVKVKGVAGGYVFGPKNVTPSGGKAAFSMTAANSALPANIRPGADFSIHWQFSKDGGANWI